ncbi:hypothetical protein BH11MYX4_BH11MYX4_29120 [soil metagenome]
MTTARHIVTRSLCALVLGALATACGPASECLEHGTCLDSQPAGSANDADDAGAGGGSATSAPSCTVFGQPHLGLGGEDLAAKADGPPSGDRARAKPYTALLTEYGRVLGSQNAPSAIDETGPTFGVPADRWYLEPIASAVFVNTAFDVAFEGCLKMTGDLAGGSGDAKYAAAPTKATAGVACADWIRRFWSRTGTPDSIDTCVAVATETTSETYGRPSVDETTRATTPQRRWAYACASVLTATGFLTF